jgi:hypothetical protein
MWNILSNYSIKGKSKRNIGYKIDYLICTILYNALMDSVYTASKNCIIVNSELEGVLKEAVVD